MHLTSFYFTLHNISHNVIKFQILQHIIQNLPQYIIRGLGHSLDRKQGMRETAGGDRHFGTITNYPASRVAPLDH